MLISLDRLHDDVVEQHGHHVTSRYVETFWLPILGPSSIWLLRHCSYRTAARQVRHVDELGACIGITSPGAVERTLERLVRFECAVQDSPLIWRLRTHLGPLPQRNVKRLPESLRALHHVVEANPASVFWPEGAGVLSGPVCRICGGSRYSISGGDIPDVICTGCDVRDNQLDAQRVEHLEPMEATVR